MLEKFTSRMLTLVPSATTKYRVTILALVLSLCAYSNSIHDRTWLYREAILPPSKAPWNHLFLHGDHSLFLLMTGLTREAFDMLHDILKPPGHPSLPKLKGRKWSLTSEGHLRLFLFYICSTMNYKYLCLLFWCDTKCLFSHAEEYAEIGCEKVTLSSFSKDQISQPGQNAIVCIDDQQL